MTNFGEFKLKMLTKLTDLYTSKNKVELKNTIKSITSNKTLSEMYTFYENIENLNITSKDKAKLYVESIEPILIEKMKTVKKDLKNFTKELKDIESEKNSLYENLDILSEETTIHNISKKIDARENLIEHLLKEKKQDENPSEIQIENHSLLNAVLVNNFNIKYSDFLSEEQKETFNKIVSMPNDELIKETKNLKKELSSKIDSLIKESSEDTLKDKLKNVMSEINKSDTTKFDYYKLIELKNGLL
jgi:hypothetical protein